MRGAIMSLSLFLVTPSSAQDYCSLLLDAAGVSAQSHTSRNEAGDVVAAMTTDVAPRVLWSPSQRTDGTAWLMQPVAGHGAFFNEPCTVGPIRWQDAYMATTRWFHAEPLVLEPTEDPLCLQGYISVTSAMSVAPSVSNIPAAEIVELRSDCPVSSLNRVPIQVTEEPLRLTFRWDLHNAIEVAGSFIEVVFSNSSRARFPITLGRAPLPFDVGNEGLRVRSPGELFSVRVTNMLEGLSLIQVTSPAALEVLGARRGTDGEMMIELRATALMQQHFRASPLFLLFDKPTGGGALLRRVPVEVLGPRRDARHQRCISVVGAEGEEILISSDDGAEPRALHPQRFPTLVDFVDGPRRRTSVTIGAAGTELLLEHDGLPMCLRFRTTPRVAEAMEDWNQACYR